MPRRPRSNSYYGFTRRDDAHERQLAARGPVKFEESEAARPVRKPVEPSERACCSLQGCSRPAVETIVTQLDDSGKWFSQYWLCERHQGEAKP
jgi:hypothetical protein